jgi:hypothetical protein
MSRNPRVTGADLIAALESVGFRVLRMKGSHHFLRHDMTILRAGRRKQLLGQIEMNAPLCSPPALIGDALYLATANRLYLIAAKL